VAAVDSHFRQTGMGREANRLWHRVRWFDVHAPHGMPWLVRIEPESGRGGPWGLEMVFECPRSGSY
jgi:hypothetical protein